ncbi:GGDEF domain-containing protein [Salinibacterium sp. GXW1014]|uniref:GGDEF domain-containing protein n=1 Tax=Salinibacterium sp. GXW1014 TaxID=3377838 RepID=UPI00383BDF52
MGTRHVVHVGKDVTQEIGQRLDEHQKAQRDPLTGLYNRRGGEEALVGVRAASDAAHTTFSVLMCDIDRFKLVNDTHGHAVGDQMLIEVARVLDGGVRAGDSVVRWGGEEFLLVLSETSAAAAFALAERLRLAISGRDIQITGAVTVSMGVAEWNEGDGLASLVSRADAALYVSKTSGRNRTTLADSSGA